MSSSNHRSICIFCDDRILPHLYERLDDPWQFVDELTWNDRHGYIYRLPFSDFCRIGERASSMMEWQKLDPELTHQEEVYGLVSTYEDSYSALVEDDSSWPLTLLEPCDETFSDDDDYGPSNDLEESDDGESEMEPDSVPITA